MLFVSELSQQEAEVEKALSYIDLLLCDFCLVERTLKETHTILEKIISAETLLAWTKRNRGRIQ